jgi:hypothetical protein
MSTFRKVSSTLDNGASFHVLPAQVRRGQGVQDERALLL